MPTNKNSIALLGKGRVIRKEFLKMERSIGKELLKRRVIRRELLKEVGLLERDY